MDARALRVAAASLILSVVTATWPADAQPDPFTTMNALRVTPPTAPHDVTFQGLDGKPARLSAFRGRPVLLTFFTTW